MSVVNLRQAKKQRARVKKAKDATSRAALYGRTKAQKSADERTELDAKAQLDGHKLERE